MKTKTFLSIASATLFAISVFSCSGEDGSSCTVKESDNGFDVFCDGERVGEIVNGADGEDFDCIIEINQTNPSISDVYCNGRVVGELKNGIDGTKGEQGVQGEQGEGCSVVEIPDSSAYLRMVCGGKETTKTEKTWPKATCGAIAYDPEEMTCNKSALSFTFNDNRDKKTYKAVVIDKQIWMAENLNYSAYPDTSLGKCYKEIPPAASVEASNNCKKYGRLYDWATAMGIDAICPEGWHLPSSEEWSTLFRTIGGQTATIAGTKLKAMVGWDDYFKEYTDSIINVANTYYTFTDGNASSPLNDPKNYSYRYRNYFSGNGTDDYGFSALPAGYGTDNNIYDKQGTHAYWWASTESPNDSTMANSIYIKTDETIVNITESPKSSFYSIRCVKD